MVTSAALLLVATGLLAAGVVQEVLGLLYLSMAASVAAGAVLAVAVTRAGGSARAARLRHPPG